MFVIKRTKWRRAVLVLAAAALAGAPASLARTRGSGSGGQPAGQGGPPGKYSFPTGNYRGRTSQGEPFSFHVSKARLRNGYVFWKVTDISFGAIENCLNADGSMFTKTAEISGLPIRSYLPIAFPGVRYGNSFRGSVIFFGNQFLHFSGRLKHSDASGVLGVFQQGNTPPPSCGTGGTPGNTGSGITWTAHHV